MTEIATEQERELVLLKKHLHEVTEERDELRRAVTQLLRKRDELVKQIEDAQKVIEEQNEEINRLEAQSII